MRHIRIDRAGAVYLRGATGRDPRESFEDMKTLEKRVSEVILNGFGEWLAEQIGDPVEKA